MRPPYRSRRARAKHHYDQAQVDRDTGEVLEPEESTVFRWCEYCEREVTEDADDDHGSDFPHEWGRSVDGVLYGARFGYDVGEWPVREDGLVMLTPDTWKIRTVK